MDLRLMQIRVSFCYTEENIIHSYLKSGVKPLKSRQHFLEGLT